MLWLGNVPQSDADNLTKMGYRIGKPQPENGLTVEQLESQGLVGLYTRKDVEDARREMLNDYGE